MKFRTMNRLRNSRFIRNCAIIVSVLFSTFVFTTVCIAQITTPPKSKLTIREDRDDEQPPSVGEMIEKQRILRQKKEYDEMLKRGDEALKLSEELETSFNKSESLSPRDLEKLAALEKVVGKIRNDLGGDNDNDKVEDSTGPENNARHDVISAFKFLRSSTVRLVDELKKSSRFSISVAAVESSNAVIRIARFLRLKK
jgi:hypothetical protein